MKRYLFASVMMLLMIPLLLAAQGVTFTASVDKNTLAVDEQFTLELTLNGGGMGGGTFRNFPMSQVHGVVRAEPIVECANHQRLRVVVGHVSYVLQPREAGRFTLGAATIESGGKQYSSPPIEITVVKGTAKPKQSAASGQASDNTVQVGDNLFCAQQWTVRAFILENRSPSHSTSIRVSALQTSPPSSIR